MNHIDLSSYPRDTLENILRIMKGYRSTLKQIGKRAILFDQKNPPALQAIIEYAPGMDESPVKKYADACIRISFPGYTGAAPIFRKNPDLTGGVRVFVGDDMVDISFQRFETLIKH